ncbi:AbiJ-NTD4 domain-containing protein [Exiguobacterium sp. RIT594]|uniref:AbiJ-NTD4 domain-containing protein n=1 Tax=Exiguobacterium sp. RIT594 TaxID=2282449 RepID=UPI000DF76925|nr:hypothetical protein [Exiguobacterium sp. RIT594]RDB32066.1 hypothetical protein DVG79_14915 [Exiguobacterium sp. RIT594]
MSNNGSTGRELYSERMFPTSFDVLRYEVIPEKARIQIFQHFNNLIDELPSKNEPYVYRDAIFNNAMKDILLRRGVLDYVELLPSGVYSNVNYLNGDNNLSKINALLSRVEKDFFLLLIFADEKDYLLILDLIEILSYCVADLYLKSSSEKIDQAINNVFRKNGIGYELVKNQIIHKGNEVVHKEIIRPSLNFLSDSGYSGANEEMLQAFSEFRNNNFKGAIHNASKAFESTMKIIIEKNNWELINPNPRQPVPSLNKATAHVLIATIANHSQVESFHSNALRNLRDTLQTLANLRNSHTGHGQGSVVTETYIRHCEFALHTAAANILYLIKTFD